MTPSQIEKAARDHADKHFIQDAEIFCNKPWDKAKEYYAKTLVDFAKYCISHQWIPVTSRLPEEKKVVLCHMPDMKDNYAEKDMYFDIAILLEGKFINLDAETVHPSHWMPIPSPKLKPEKEKR